MSVVVFVQYLFMLATMTVISRQVAHLVRDLHQLDSKVDFLIFVKAQEAAGKSPAEIVEAVKSISEKVRAEMAFAEIAREESKPWWRKIRRA